MADVILKDAVLDGGIDLLNTAASALWVCSSAPTDYADAVTKKLGSKTLTAGAVFGNPADASPNGRQVTSVAVTDGVVDASGTVAVWAAIDVPNTRLLAVGDLSGGMAVTSGWTWTLGAFTVRQPASASAYVGPLDLFGSAAGAWGARALSAAFIGQPIVRMGDVLGSPQFDVVALSDGSLDRASAMTALAGQGGRYVKFYDQSGNGNHLNASSLGSSADFVNNTNGAAWINDAPNYSSSPMTLTQPFASSAVYYQANTPGTYDLYNFAGAVPRQAMRMGSYTFIDASGASELFRTSAASVSTWYASQALFNGASSKLLINGTSGTSFGALTGDVSSVALKFGDSWGTNSGPISYIREIIVWDADPGDTLRSSIESNQRTFWGF